eukprot:6576982-Pyramimonas_sp.AAC.1
MKLTCHDFHIAELDNRIASGWRRFNQLRREFSCKRYPLASRLRLFNGAVPPSVMCGCSPWALTKD